MKKYKFYNVVFTPDEYHQIKFDDKKVHLSPLQSKLLTYLVESPGKTKEKDDILKDVWEGKERHYDVITRTISELKSKLPNTCNFTHVPRKGYAFEHDVIIEQPKFERLERLFAHSPGVKHFLHFVVSVLGFAVIASSGYGISNSHSNANPPPEHRLSNAKTLFTRERIVGNPQLFSDGRFIVHRQSKDIYVDDKLALYDAELGDTKALVSMGPFDGFGLSLTGDKIVYQNTTKGNCEIRLLRFKNDDKTDFDDELLTDCFKSSGYLNFAWFNDSEFYVNFTAKEQITTANELPAHHLYAFNIDTKAQTPIARADYKGGIGFYSLTYDKSTESLYFLQAKHFSSTDVYRYRNNQLVKIQTINYLVSYITVSNDRLVYLNKAQNFVINSPAAEFNNNELILPQRNGPINMPHLQGNKLAYIEGQPFNFTLIQWRQGQLNNIPMQGFSPKILAKYHNKLVFTANQTGTTQVYLLTDNFDIQRISNMQENENITDIKIANDFFVISYYDRVDIYRLVNTQLVLLKSIANVQNGVINQSGDKLLLSKTTEQGTAQIIEKHISDLTNTGRIINGATLALYDQDNFVYLNHDNELILLKGTNKKVIAPNIKLQLLSYTAIKDGYFYFITLENNHSLLNKVELATGIKTTELLHGIHATRFQFIDDVIYLRTRKPLTPKIMLGKIIIQ